MTIASSNEAKACALTRSAGTKAVPSLRSPRCACTAVTGGLASPPTVTFPPATGELCNPRSFRSGVNRHSSSRPDGTGKSSSENDECSCNRDTGAVDSTAP